MADALNPELKPDLTRVGSVESQPEAAPVATPEVQPAPEAAPEEPEVEAPAEPEETPEQVPAAAPAPAPVVAPVVQKDELTKEVEQILSEDLEAIYKSLPADRRAKFKEEGEKTAGLIKQMIEHGKFHARRIVDLIRKWLSLIPGVNRFFLEQEAKIKADKLQMMAEQNKHE